MDKVHIPEHIRRHPAVWWSRLKLRWPFFVWVLAAVAAVFFYLHGGQFGGMSGAVDTVREEVAPLETARLKALRVVIGQRVKAGDVLAEMDTSVLDAEMAVEKLQVDRQFAQAVSRVEAALRDARIRQAETMGELEVLTSEIERMDQLLAKQLIDAQTVSRLRARKEALAQAAEFYPEMIRNLEEDLERAQKRMATVESEMGSEASAAAGEPDVETSRQRLGLLDLRRASYALRAGSDGIVSRLYHGAGDVVQGGIPIMTLVQEGVQRVIGFLPEHSAQDVTVGMPVYMTRAVGGGPVFSGKVTALVPEIMALPTRASPVPAQTWRGRRVIIDPLGPNDLLPGEGVSIYFERPWLTMLLNRPRKAAAAEGGGSR